MNALNKIAVLSRLANSFERKLLEPIEVVYRDKYRVVSISRDSKRFVAFLNMNIRANIVKFPKLIRSKYGRRLEQEGNNDGLISQQDYWAYYARATNLRIDLERGLNK